MLQVTIEAETLETRPKKGGGTYQVQTGYIQTYDAQGKPKKYPESFAFFPPRVGDIPTPYPAGNYILAPQSLRINRGFLELGSVTLIQRKP